MKGLGKTKIELGTASWNPICGCNNNCPWCWSRNRVAPRLKCERCRKFELHVHDERWEQPFNTKKPQRVLVCWTGDAFSWKEKDDDMGAIERMFYEAERAPWHKYLFLTRCPQNIPQRDYPDNWWFGTSITGEENKSEILMSFLDINTGHTFLMIEPLRGKIIPCIHFLDWVVVGAQTGKNPIVPDIVVIKDIINECKESDTPLFFKDNLLSRLPDLPRVQQIPEDLKKEWGLHYI